LNLTRRQGLPSVRVITTEQHRDGRGPDGQGRGRHWKIGELATATGLTVRTLHHFDQIGLLQPAARSEAGHRRYAEDDVRRLYQILALRQLGIPLGRIGASIDGRPGELEQAVRAQLDQVERDHALLGELRRRLRALLDAAGDRRAPAIDQLIDSMEAMMAAPHLTPDQHAQLRARHEEVGADELARWQDEIAGLVERLAEHLRLGTDPSDPAVQELTRLWTGSFERMVGGDRTILSSLYGKLDAKGPEAATRGVVSAEVWAYLKRAFAAGYGAPA
jgi:DNA-binding transcriptional MerR regulator